MHAFTALLSGLFGACPEMALFLALVIGCWIGRFRFGSFQLGGVAGSLLSAVLISQVGVHIDSGIKSVLFALFIYAVGYQSGPQFFRSLGRQSLKEILMAVMLAITGLITVVAVARIFHLDKGLAAGLAAGGLTQSAIIGTAGSSLEKIGLPLAQVQQLQGNVAVGYAVTYIFGSIGPILLCVNVLPWFMKRGIREDAIRAEAEQAGGVHVMGEGEVSAFPNLVGRAYRLTQSDLTIAGVESMAAGVTVEQVLRDGKPAGIGADAALLPGDQLLLVGQRSEVLATGQKIGQEIGDVPGLDLSLIRRDVVLSRKDFVGKTVDQCVQSLSAAVRHGVYLVALSRAGKAMPVTGSMQVKDGDIVTLLGTSADVQRAAAQIGTILLPSIKTDLVFHSLGVALGLLIGLGVVHMGSVPLTLGSGGGALLSGLLFGWYQSRHPVTGNMPQGASTFLVDFGLAGFVAVTGLQTGQQAIATIMQHGITLFLLGVVVTLVPLILTMLFGRYVLRYNNTAIFAGALAGSRSANPAFGEVLNKAGNAVPTTPFAITYAVANVLLTLLGPLVVAFS
ncbi:aspartate-alanine antiporter [Acetobacter pasteurianus]|uniref:Aspartate:alanine antiporter n=2 Tax=Acetobacter pasteurianus TaxID=438 RepID=C7JB85_ACEP3|nr:aspartate-alanine antiporter [Acetobacter pasteurianus]ASC06717.1 putative transporter [Acetobacter pasteurianus subsp. pasteurianus]BAH99688.1 aspartate:alanine antiporter [Acetobacter pasteurianus IFO 3283-01]BAI02741.1 aspartate:alanine antiporter [Acetobacter pasteurianus IFO 3283-03]BAI05787.1 aspartate:alanine antiporter [Acetobacter pasteurianus IFO 3283-07]BAI08836.1 aspartate:alanine antiporter [Acetobacter pasteurianus IFO 3283-22]